MASKIWCDSFESCFFGSPFFWVVATQIFFIFTPILGEMIQFDEHIFQRGWFNHQLVLGGRAQFLINVWQQHEDCVISTVTPPKINMEPENGPLEKEIPIGNHHFQVPC